MIRGYFFSTRSSTDRAAGFGPVGWGFESLRVHHYSTRWIRTRKRSGNLGFPSAEVPKPQGFGEGENLPGAPLDSLL